MAATENPMNINYNKSFFLLTVLDAKCLKYLLRRQIDLIMDHHVRFVLLNLEHTNLKCIVTVYTLISEDIYTLHFAYWNLHQEITLNHKS